MNKNEALSFLKQNQPMPNDDDLSEDLIEKYDQVRLFFTEYPDDEAISYFLNSFGEWSCAGVYQLIEGVLFLNTSEIVVKEIKKVLENKNTPNSVRYWVSIIAGNFPSSELIEGLNLSLQSKNEDIRQAASASLDCF